MKIADPDFYRKTFIREATLFCEHLLDPSLNIAPCGRRHCRRWIVLLTTRRQTCCCFWPVWSLFSAAGLPKSRAALSDRVPHGQGGTAVGTLASGTEWVKSSFGKPLLSSHPRSTVSNKRGAENGCSLSPGWLKMAVILYLCSNFLPSPSSFFQTSYTQPSLSLALPFSSPSWSAIAWPAGSSFTSSSLLL